MSDAVIAAIIGAVVTVMLTFLIPWLLGKVPSLRDWFLSTDHPIRLVVGTAIFCALSSSLIVALTLASLIGGTPKIKIEPEKEAVGAPGYLGQADGSRICVFSTIHRNSTAAGETSVKIVGNQWTFSRDLPAFEFTQPKCYSLTITK